MLPWLQNDFFDAIYVVGNHNLRNILEDDIHSKATNGQNAKATRAEARYP